MKLLEYKGKELLKRCGIKTPSGIVVNNKSYINLSYHKNIYTEFFFDNKEVIIKAQVIGTGRKKAGLIESSSDYQGSLRIIDEMYKKSYNGIKIDTILVEKKLDIKEEYFVSISYDSTVRKPLILFIKSGGIDVDNQKDKITFHISPVKGLREFEARKIAKKAGLKERDLIQLSEILLKCFNCFQKYDCKTLEINPLVKTADGFFYALDSKITIDDSAIPRLEDFADVAELEHKTFLSEREVEARKIDLNDYRGVAGKTFIELDGDIAVLASGGGASLTCMDALIEAGGTPANYTEYSGNPPREKVRRLTEITLSKDNLKGCLVIGGTANFTDIYETLAGFCEGIKSLPEKPKYPIVIRRAGPRDKEAFEMIKNFAENEKLNIKVFGEETPMTEAVKIFVQETEKYKNDK